MAILELTEHDKSVLTKMDELGIYLDDELKHPFGKSTVYGCVIEKSFGVNVMVFSSYDEYFDASWIEYDADDPEFKENVEFYTMWVVVRNGEEVFDYDVLGGVDIDGRMSNRMIKARLGGIALDMLDGMQDKIDAAVKAAGERIARYI